VARDLHDLLGHSLSLITLKSELASRLVEKNSEQAAREVIEIEHVARQALREVREAIAGYRTQTLASELDGARQILEAAGINLRVEHTAGVLPPGIDVALAWTVREGVTNVIRHSRAKECLIHIAGQDGIVRAEVISDGYPQPDRRVKETGTGISGLAERITAQGGTVDAAPFFFENRSGFRLVVELPVQNNLARKEQQG
jgi:two-component system sensor histidine kinase DesK